MIAQAEENSILPTLSMAVFRKILIFIVLTASIIMLGRLIPKIFPANIKPALTEPPHPGLESPHDSTNALPAIDEDTSGGKWQSKLFDPLLQNFGLPAKHLKPKKGYFEIVFPKGKPIHDYALDIEKLCRQHDITVEEGVELHPTGRSIEYRLSSNGQHIKLRASLGALSMAGSAKLAIIFINLDSLRENQLSALENSKWEKTLSINAYSPNIALKKLRFTSAQNEILLDLPMEPSNYPFLNPGKNGLYIHQTQEEVTSLLSEALDSLPKAKGYTTKYGDRAIENQPLLEKIFQFTTEKKLAFVDLTGSQRSLARQAAAATGGRSRTLTPFTDSQQVAEELIKRALLAQKTGEAFLVLPFSNMALKSISESMRVNESRFDELGLEFVTLSHLLARAGDSLSTPLVVTKPKSPLLKPLDSLSHKPVRAVHKISPTKPAPKKLLKKPMQSKAHKAIYGKPKLIPKRSVTK